jgi:hypothetical protein
MTLRPQQETALDTTSETCDNASVARSHPIHNPTADRFCAMLGATSGDTCGGANTRKRKNASI